MASREQPEKARYDKSMWLGAGKCNHDPYSGADVVMARNHLSHADTPEALFRGCTNPNCQPHDVIG